MLVIRIYGKAYYAFASVKCPIANVCYAARYVNTCEAFATTERTIADACNGVWDCDACKACAIKERLATTPEFTGVATVFLLSNCQRWDFTIFPHFIQFILTFSSYLCIL